MAASRALTLSECASIRIQATSAFRSTPAQPRTTPVLRALSLRTLKGSSGQQPRIIISTPPPRQEPNRRRTSGRRTICSSTRDGDVASQTSQDEKIDYFKNDSRPVILFDGVCNLCNGGVNFVLDWDPQSRVRFAALQSSAGRALLQQAGRAPDDISSIVLVGKHKAWIKSEAVLRIGEYLQLPFPAMAQLAMFFPLIIRDQVYDQVAANRYNFFGKSNSCRVSDPTFADRFIE
mmetsp:Transcript_1146/g.1339  ORF Transcript_1146/g.1339 Transcript_1146/m.1339 type:complete len:234 (-) Transcript_1146:465-1166(-)|eukprot:CAMPEP_0197854490 /NCGR_PEP_ID=MMETSP1438-20131217/24782_1 /TAXON_ID=1461541 /ORGANISM="Pterosperma sp., Strain CCMP1384" /LENGTH=233 /DNA_ID=CAMNT_0043469251 /DNA_START=213 /DNA_END=914 /DNA_ORIENTATION=-